jgi:hypothetical protein
MFAHRHVSNAPSGEPEVLVRNRAGERLVADGDPQLVRDPAVADSRSNLAASPSSRRTSVVPGEASGSGSA